MAMSPTSMLTAETAVMATTVSYFSNDRPYDVLTSKKLDSSIQNVLAHVPFEALGKGGCSRK